MKNSEERKMPTSEQKLHKKSNPVYTELPQQKNLRHRVIDKEDKLLRDMEEHGYLKMKKKTKIKIHKLKFIFRIDLILGGLCIKEKEKF